MSAGPTDRELLLQILDELQALRAELHGAPPAAPLLAAIEEEFGLEGSFTAGGLIDLADRDTWGALARALETLIDVNGDRHGRAVALGRMLARIPSLEIVGRRRGVTVYRLGGFEPAETHGMG